MKFYIPNNHIYKIEDIDIGWLLPAEFVYHERSIVLLEFSNGWIVETDENFNTYFTLISGKQLPTITDQEYSQLILDKKTFLCKKRAEEFRTAWAKFFPSR